MGASIRPTHSANNPESAASDAPDPPKAVPKNGMVRVPLGAKKQKSPRLNIVSFYDDDDDDDDDGHPFSAPLVRPEVSSGPKYIRKRDRNAAPGDISSLPAINKSDSDTEPPARDKNSFLACKSSARQLLYINKHMDTWSRVDSRLPHNTLLQEHLAQHARMGKWLSTHLEQLHLTNLLAVQLPGETAIEVANFKLFVHSLVHNNGQYFVREPLEVFIAILDRLGEICREFPADPAEIKSTILDQGDHVIKRTVTKVRIPPVVAKRLLSGE